MNSYTVKTNIAQANDYYPFGLSSTSYARTASLFNPYLYNQSSRLEEETEWYHTPFRKYDASIGRFTGVDALASSMASINSYHYAYNNPVNFSDPTGLDPSQENRSDGLEDYSDDESGSGGGGGGGFFGRRSRMGWSNGTGFNANGSIHYGATGTGGSGRGGSAGDAIYVDNNGNLIIDFRRIGPHGGTWDRRNGYRDFDSQYEAYAYGRGYNDYHGSWRHTSAGSKSGSDTRFREIRMRELMQQQQFLLSMMMTACETGDCPYSDPKWYQVLWNRLSNDMENLWKGSWAEDFEEWAAERINRNSKQIQTNEPSINNPVINEDGLGFDDTNPTVGRKFTWRDAWNDLTGGAYWDIVERRGDTAFYDHYDNNTFGVGDSLFIVSPNGDTSISFRNRNWFRD